MFLTCQALKRKMQNLSWNKNLLSVTLKNHVILTKDSIPCLVSTNFFFSFFENYKHAINPIIKKINKFRSMWTYFYKDTHKMSRISIVVSLFANTRQLFPRKNRHRFHTHATMDPPSREFPKKSPLRLCQTSKLRLTPENLFDNTFPFPTWKYNYCVIFEKMMTQGWLHNLKKQQPR